VLDPSGGQAAPLWQVRESLSADLLPVLHGDAVLTDDDRGSAILSGDTLCIALSEEMTPDLCIFLTDVTADPARPKLAGRGTSKLNP
jgi:isopentenyl phosphate kinase